MTLQLILFVTFHRIKLKLSLNSPNRTLAVKIQMLRNS